MLIEVTPVWWVCSDQRRAGPAHLNTPNGFACGAKLTTVTVRKDEVTKCPKCAEIAAREVGPEPYYDTTLPLRVDELECEVTELRAQVALAAEALADDRDVTALNMLRGSATRRTPNITKRIVDLLSRTPYYENPQGLAEKIENLIFEKVPGDKL